jgi:hypothetical protein
VIQKRKPNPGIPNESRRRLQRVRKSVEYDPVQELKGHNPAHIELLLTLRDEAVATDGYFIGPPVKRVLASELIEIDRKVRKNPVRRRIVGMLAQNLNIDHQESNEFKLILGVCHAFIIDPTYELGDLSDEFRERVTETVGRLCTIVSETKLPVIVTFSCLAIKNFATDFKAQYPAINFITSDEMTLDSELTIILQPTIIEPLSLLAEIFN